MKNRPLFTICLAVFAAVCVLTGLGGERFVRELRTSPLERSVRPGSVLNVSGQVCQKELKSDYQIIYLKNISVKVKNHILKESHIIIYDDKKNKVQIGNIITAAGEVSFFEPARNPGNFDQRLYYQRLDIHARLWSASVTVTDKSKAPFKEKLWNIRQEWKKLLYRAIGEERGSLLGAVMLGDKADIDAEAKELYQKNGIGHILAISGLHLSFIGIGVYELMRRVSGSYMAGGLCGILFLSVYILMAGCSVSAVRAMVMFLFRVGADMAGRCYDAATALSVAAMLVVLWRPLYLYDGGFWLSFGAVLGVIAVLPVFRKLPVQGLWASVGINLTILPVLLYYFYEFPPYSVILNLLVIPLMSLLLLLGFTGSLAAAIFFPAGELVLKGCGLILWLYERLCSLFLCLPGSRIVTGRPGYVRIILYYVCLILALLLWKRFADSVAAQARKLGAVCVFTVFLGIAALMCPQRHPGELEITVLDVGQGDGIFMREPSGATYLIDGGSSDVKSVGRYRIEPYLKSKGVGTLDYVWISHGDTDHINGVKEMLKRQELGIRIRTLVLPSQNVWDQSLYTLASEAAKEGVQVAEARPGTLLKKGEFTMECIQPGEDYSGEKGNAASMVLAVRYGYFAMLFTGDVEGEGEEMLTGKLAEMYNECTWEVLKVAHHGSKYSSEEEMLGQLHPRYAVISAGVDNRYGHPHQETVERLKKEGCGIYSTRDQGAVMIDVQGDELRIQGYLP